MNIDISCRPAAAAAELTLAAGETVTVEVGAMIAMDTQIQVETTSQSRGQFRRKGLRGILQGLRRLLSGESFFLNHFTATAEGQKLILGSTLVGDIIANFHRRAFRGGCVILRQNGGFRRYRDF